MARELVGPSGTPPQEFTHVGVVGGCWETSNASDSGGFELGEEGLAGLARRAGQVVDMGWRFSRLHSPDIQRPMLSLAKGPDVWAPSECHLLPTSSRKQCIELEQQFDFLKDLVASVPDMQGDGEDNHMDGDKGTRR